MAKRCVQASDVLDTCVDVTPLKDWRSAKPRMHKPSQTDPPPDDPEYDSQVRCEHGCLTSNALSRKRISLQVSLTDVA